MVKSGEIKHTTGNSIRHIIEVLSSFECPKKDDLSEYIRSTEILKEDLQLYTFMNNASHGDILLPQSGNTTQIISSCKTIIDFIKKEYPNQLEGILQE